MSLSLSLLSILLLIGIIAGFIGGVLFYKIKNSLPKKLHKTFDVAALLMLAQDVLIALFFLQGVYEIVIFMVIIFIVPAIGFLSSMRIQVSFSL